MPPLTGPFDVAVQIGLRAINRALAAQHMGPGDGTAPMYPHALEVPVEDRAHGLWGSLEAVVGPPRLTLEGGEPVPSDTGRGRPPIPLRSRARVVVHFRVRARYAAGPGSTPAPESAHGELRLTVNVSQLFSPRGDLLDVDFTSPDVGVSFEPAPGLALDAAQRRLVEQVLRALLRSLDPVNAVIPPTPAAREMRFKVLTGAPPAVSLLWQLSDSGPLGAGAEDGASARFLRDDNGLAMAVSREYVERLLLDTVGALPPVAGPLGHRFTFSPPRFEPAGRSVLVTIDGQAEGIGAATFTIRQRLVIALGPGGPYVRPEGAVELDTEPLLAAITELSGQRPQIERLLTAARDELVSEATMAMQAILTLEGAQALARALRVPDSRLRFTDVLFTPDGLVAQMAMGLGPWRRAQVPTPTITPVPGTELELNAGESLPGGWIERSLPSATVLEFNARASWIPGGWIDSYEWSGGAASFVEADRFTRRTLTPNVRILSRRCLLVRGRQMSESGNLVDAPGGICFVEAPGFPGWLPGRAAIELGHLLASQLALPIPMGDPAPYAYVNPAIGNFARIPTRANLLAHFAGKPSEGWLDPLAKLLAERQDPGLIALAVAPAAPLNVAQSPAAGDEGGWPVLVTDDPAGAWAAVLGAKQEPSTMLFSPEGSELWRAEGELSLEDVAARLDEHRVEEGCVTTGELRCAAAVGHAPPDFELMHAAGRPTMLRKLRGQPLVLCFWAPWAKPSVGELAALGKAASDAEGRDFDVIAVADGTSAADAEAALGGALDGLALVADPDRAISAKYGINCWPTTVHVDERGLVISVHCGAGTHPGATGHAGQQEKAADDKGARR